VGYFTRSNDFYLPSLRVEEVGGGGGQHSVVLTNDNILIGNKMSDNCVQCRHEGRVTYCIIALAVVTHLAKTRIQRL
jgi:hypothetical protein